MHRNHPVYTIASPFLPSFHLQDQKRTTIPAHAERGHPKNGARGTQTIIITPPSRPVRSRRAAEPRKEIERGTDVLTIPTICR